MGQQPFKSIMLLVGYCDEYLVAKAKEYSSDPILVTEKNWQEFIQKSGVVGYTGIEEFADGQNFIKLLDAVGEIIYYSYPLHSIETKKSIEYQLMITNQKRPVLNLTNNLADIEDINFKLNSFLNLADVRKTDQSQLWFAGCSITHGDGIDKNHPNGHSTTQRYSYLISKKLNKDASYLTYGGSSVTWAADQILRSDIRKNDIVVWGLTASNRFVYYINDKVKHINVGAYEDDRNLEKIVPKKLLIDDDNLRYESMTSIHQVINFCNKVQAKLLIIGLLTSEEDFKYLYTLPNFYEYNKFDSYVDFGPDGCHPGPKQHELYADVIIQQLKKRNWI